MSRVRPMMYSSAAHINKSKGNVIVKKGCEHEVCSRLQTVA